MWKSPLIAARALHNHTAKALRGQAQLWVVFWLYGIPVVSAAMWLGISAEDFRYAEEHFWGAVIDTLKFLLCLFWLISAWRCVHNTGSRFWRGAGRFAISIAILFVDLTY